MKVNAKLLNKYRTINNASCARKQIIKKELIENIINDKVEYILNDDVAAVYYIWAKVFNLSGIDNLRLAASNNLLINHIFDDNFIDYVNTNDDKRLLVRFYCAYEIIESEIPTEILDKYNRVKFFVANNHFENKTIEEIQKSRVSLQLYLKTVASHAV